MGVEGDEARRGGSSSVVRWGRFLPRMAVRVLLVEADDSTRQLITALLRKCHYKVAAVADGLRAWEVLKERSRNIDLILTEVDLPSISGFALLSLITEDDFCKNIPVIMMSSHDSIGTVHKCMMRGASDFLMKPIRINELKNLWQHVWRRQSCHLAMGFGLSLQVESVEQMKIHEATAENNAVSDQSSGSKALSQREEEYFKKGSDAQSSCTNPSLEAKSAYAEEESQGLSRTKKKLKPLVCDAEVPQADEGSGKNLCPRASMIAGSDMRQGGKVEGQSFLVTGSDLGSQASERTATRAESSREAIDLIGAFDNKGIYGGSCSSNGAKILESSELNLSWRGFQLNGFESNTNRNNVLIQSNASAFSRYTNYKQSQIPKAAAARDVKSWQHSTGEQRFICIDESRKQEQKVGSVDKESVCNWVGRAACASENGDDDERCLSVAARTQREAALMKFRLKRKERCYEKKVRYESRKKLADQRPRVKGQFVRRIPPDPPYASVGG